MIDGFLDDVRRYDSKRQSFTFVVCVKLLANYHGLQALLGYRLGRTLLQVRGNFLLWPLLPFGWLAYFAISRYVWWAFDIRLHLSAAIGPGLYIGHFGNILVRQCRIGRHCSIAQSVHIKPAAGADATGPVVGDRVWIGAHAQIVGPFQIGSESTIGAGGKVLRDVSERALCLGNPARVVLRNYDNRSILGINV